MSSLTPSNDEFNLLSSYVEEALDLLGQDCKVYTIFQSNQETASDSVFEYNEPFNTHILFEDDLRDVKLKNKSWDKEVDIEIVAYISLSDLEVISKHCIVEVTPSFYNKDSKFLITDIFGQVNTTYARVKLVPYRKSLRTSTDQLLDDKVITPTENTFGIIKRKSILKR